MQFLDWFIKEQGEEEKNAEDMLRTYERYGHEAKRLVCAQPRALRQSLHPFRNRPCNVTGATCSEVS